MSAATTTTEEAATKITPAVAKVAELIGVSNVGWEDAAGVALEEAKKEIHNIHRIKIQDLSAEVDPTTTIITSYKTLLNYHLE
jgi:flavin-binding protein dodecin